MLPLNSERNRGASNPVRTVWQLLKATTIEWWNDNTFRLAASLAFYTIFSLAPVLLIAVGIASISSPGKPPPRES